MAAIKLPGGHCPREPASNWGAFHTNPYNIYSIPFSAEKPTHFFRRLSEANIKDKVFCIEVWFHKDGLLNKIAEFERNDVEARRCVFFDSRVIARNNVSYTVESNALGGCHKGEKEVELCPTPIYEEVRIWYEGPLTFIWSCAEGENQGEHEESLIIKDDLLFNLSQRNPSTQEEVRAAASKYMSRNLVDLIILGKDIDLDDGLQEDFYKCPRNGPSRNAFVLIILGVLFLFFLGVYCLFHVTKE